MKAKKDSITNESILAVGVIIYFFFYENFQFLFSYASAYVFCLFLVVLSFIIMVIHIREYRKYLECLPWFLFMIISMINNHILKNHEYMISFCNYTTAFIAAMALARTPNWVNNSVKAIEKCGMVFVFTTILMFLIRPMDYLQVMLFQKYTGPIDNEYRAGIAANYSANGIYISIAFIVYVSYLITRKKEQIKRKNYIRCVLIAAGLLLTAKRGPLIFTIAGLIITYIIVAYQKNKYIKMIGFCISAILLFYLACYFIPALSDVVQRFTVAENGDISNGRYKFWNWAYGQYLKNKAFGIGWFGFRFNQPISISETGGYYDCHCIYIQLLCESGYVGTAITVFAMLFTWIKGLVFIKKYRKKVRQDAYFVMFASAAIQSFCILYGITGNVLYDRCFIIYIISISMQWSIHNQIKYKGLNYV